MIETRLGEFEEVILLLVGILGEEAYSFKITEEFESQTNRAVSIGAVHSTLDRLENKGFLESAMGKIYAGKRGKEKADFFHYRQWEEGIKKFKGFQDVTLESIPGICDR